MSIAFVFTFQFYGGNLGGEMEENHFGNKEHIKFLMTQLSIHLNRGSRSCVHVLLHAHVLGCDEQGNLCGILLY